MTRKRLWMNRISGIVCLLLWIAFIIFLSGTTGKIAGMALGIMLLVAVIYNLYLPKEVSTHLIIPAYAQKEEKIIGRLFISNTGVFPVLSGKVFLQVKKTISGEQEMFSMNIRAAGRKNGAAAFVIDSEYMGFLEITILRVELYSFFGCMKKVTYINQEKVVMVCHKQRNCIFQYKTAELPVLFLMRSKVVKREMVRENILESVRMLRGIL